MEIDIELPVEERKGTLLPDLSQSDISGIVFLNTIIIEGAVSLALDFADIVVLALDVNIVSLLQRQIFLNIGAAIGTTTGNDLVILVRMFAWIHPGGLFGGSHVVLRLWWK